MRPSCVLLAFGLLLTASAARAQDDPLVRITATTLDALDHLPNCTCLETLFRDYKPKYSQSPIAPLDTVRLEVLFADHREWYASPGDAHWVTDPFAFIAEGMIGNGPFAGYLRLIFASKDAVFTARDPEDGLLRYDFQISRLTGNHSLNVSGRRDTIGLKGSFWADPVSYDLRRVEVHANEIPVDLPVFDFTAAMSYTRVDIGGNSALLPRSGLLHLRTTEGEEGRNLIEFTHCRAFQADSTVRFESHDGVPSPSFSVTTTSRSSTEQSLPPDLSVIVELTEPVTERSQVGSILEGRISADLRSAGRVLIPRGTPIHGRIRAIDRIGSDYIVALEFIEVETASVWYRFFAALDSIQRVPNLEWRWRIDRTTIERRGNRRIRTTETTLPPSIPGVGVFFVTGSAFTLPAGLHLTWKTQALPGPQTPRR